MYVLFSFLFMFKSISMYTLFFSKQTSLVFYKPREFILPEFIKILSNHDHVMVMGILSPRTSPLPVVLHSEVAISIYFFLQVSSLFTQGHHLIDCFKYKKNSWFFLVTINISWKCSNWMIHSFQKQYQLIYVQRNTCHGKQFSYLLPSLSKLIHSFSYLFSKYILSILQAKCNDNSR